MRPAHRAEFQAVILALAEAYGADAGDVREAARRAVQRLPPKRRGPKVKNDDAIVRRIARLVVDQGLSVRGAAEKVLDERRRDHATPETAIAVTARKARELLKRHRRWAPGWLPEPAVLPPPQTLERADQAIAEVRETLTHEKDRAVNLKIGARMRRKYPQKRPN